MGLNLGRPEGGVIPIIENQTIIMQILLAICIICVPLMLFVRPILEHRAAMKHQDLKALKHQMNEAL